MQPRKAIAAAMLGILGVFNVNAALIPVATDGSWKSFDVSDILAADAGVGWIDISTGDALTFGFTVEAGTVATLTVVDAGFAGDRFNVFANSVLLGNTSAAVSSFPLGTVVDFDTALANPDFSRGMFTLAAGSYVIGGSLFSSVLDEGGVPLNSTLGALRVDVTAASAVPLPAAALLLLPGLGALGFVARRRGSIQLKKD